MHALPQTFAAGWLCAALAAAAVASDGQATAGSTPFTSAKLGFEFHPPEIQPRTTAPFIQPGILVFPKLTVKERRFLPDDDALLTDKGLVDLAKKTYLSPTYQVTFGPLAQVAAYYTNFLSILSGWHPNDAEALVLYRQEKRLRDLAQVDAMIDLELIDDRTQAGEFRAIRYDLSESSR